MHMNTHFNRGSRDRGGNYAFVGLRSQKLCIALSSFSYQTLINKCNFVIYSYFSLFYNKLSNYAFRIKAYLITLQSVISCCCPAQARFQTLIQGQNPGSLNKVVIITGARS